MTTQMTQPTASDNEWHEIDAATIDMGRPYFMTRYNGRYSLRPYASTTNDKGQPLIRGWLGTTNNLQHAEMMAQFEADEAAT